MHYQEFSMEKDGEIIITSNNKKQVAATLKKSDIYKRLLIKDEDRLMLFQRRGFTSQVCESDFRSALKEVNHGNLTEEKFVKYNTARLQEGVAVIETTGTPKLLVDDTRSIMSHLHGTETYILREYIVD